jgi:hypothetical protein
MLSMRFMGRRDLNENLSRKEVLTTVPLLLFNSNLYQEGGNDDGQK